MNPVDERSMDTGYRAQFQTADNGEKSMDSQERISNRKARVVARGLCQAPGIEYQVIHASTLRTMFACGSQQCVTLRQLVVQAVYLKTPFDEEGSLDQPCSRQC